MRGGGRAGRGWSEARQRGMGSGHPWAAGAAEAAPGPCSAGGSVRADPKPCAGPWDGAILGGRPAGLAAFENVGGEGDEAGRE